MDKKIIGSMAVLTLLSACSSTPRSLVDLEHVGKEETIQTYGKHDELKTAEPFKVDGGVVTATAMTTIPGSDRPEAGIKMAQARCRSQLAHSIETKLESYLQVASENTSGDTVQMRELIGESSKLVANEFKPGRVYYEKVKIISDDGLPRTEYRIWSEVRVDEGHYKRLVLDSIRKQQGRGTMSAEFAKAVDSQFNKMLTSDDQPKTTQIQEKQTEERKPASDSKPEKAAHGQ